MSERKEYKDFYVYTTKHESVAPGGSNVDNIRIQADSAFVLQKLSYFADDGNAQDYSSRVIPYATVMITDSGSGRNLMESDVSLPTLFGHGELPFILPTPKLFVPTATITVQVANFHGSDTYNIYLSFIGYKIFRI